ncbi:Zinc-binding alcohol dehydrogenase domain-containing protein cipB [Cyphellophora attinorum]|uniref:Zinc-binding alcohol dehydrogenase domain-containing protein cipB n=1 Tax=Cyphellophora attinorum TaxID=1664694 RepID=A0A0N1P2N3_9EURO|nr:Zinc-binding alcohol dehydrogenase domain-containing protein cipB [Phialophora attinorum]KPI45880.1 Zinc-binding alcohol dehydrogenase domain-containing protein cipB [Phialophora attinorum]
MTTRTNEAVWYASKGDHGTVGPAPLHHPGPGQLLIENKAVAINPADWKLRDEGWYIESWPACFGFDVAGDIVEIGSDNGTNEQSPFHIGQRVIAHALFLWTKDYAHSGFQKYTIVPASATAPLPDNVTFAAGSALPLSIDTAVHGLYDPEFLALPLPTSTTKQNSLNKTILVWGGASSVGASTIQLAAASGLTIISTSSPRNFAFVKSLGASHVLDYTSPAIIPDLISLIQQSGTHFVAPTMQLVASALETAEAPNVTSSMVLAPKAVLPPNEDIAKAIWRDYLPEALRSGTFVPSPPARVVGHGLESVPGAVEEMKRGVSAEKLVVTL